MKATKFHLALGIAFSLIAASCSQDANDASDQAVMEEHSAEEEAVHTFMLERLDLAADGIWDNAGFIITDEGEKSLYPTTDEGWAEVVAAAELITDLGRELGTMPWPDADEADWAQIAAGMGEAALAASEAAQARDEEALFDAGGYLYRTCLACHNRYAVEEGEE